MKIVFMGSADFGIPALEKLMEAHDIVGVVTTPAKPQGRGLKLIDSQIGEFAKKHDLAPILTPADLKDPSFASELKNLNADMFVVVAFRILPRTVFTIPTFGTVNIHASLLPKFRGPAPIHRAIEAGETETGVTIFRIDEGIDTGQILLQERTIIEKNETTPELYKKLSLIGADALMRALSMVESGDMKGITQDASLATRAPKLTKEEGKLDWTLSVEKIYNKIRAFKPFPGTYCFLNEKRLSIEWAEPIDNLSSSKEPGTLIEVGKDFLDIQCAQGVLRVTIVKPEGKRAMPVRDFLLGTTVSKGTKLS